MNINYGITKINNYFGLLRYDTELTDLIENRFDYESETDKQLIIRDIISYLDKAADRDGAYSKVVAMLKDKNSPYSDGFFHGLKGMKTKKAVA